MLGCTSPMHACMYVCSNTCRCWTWHQRHDPQCSTVHLSRSLNIDAISIHLTAANLIHPEHQPNILQSSPCTFMVPYVPATPHHPTPPEPTPHPSHPPFVQRQRPLGPDTAHQAVQHALVRPGRIWISLVHEARLDDVRRGGHQGGEEA